MKNPNRETVKRLEALPNIGKSIAGYLQLIGIDSPQDLKGCLPLDLYEQVNLKLGRLLDPCLLDTFMSAVDFMEGGEPRPWWFFTDDRKEMMAKLKKNEKSNLREQN